MTKMQGKDDIGGYWVEDGTVCRDCYKPQELAATISSRKMTLAQSTYCCARCGRSLNDCR